MVITPFKMRFRSWDITLNYRKSNWMYLLLLAAIGFLVYSNTIRSEFHFDDILGIIGQERIKTLKTFLHIRYWTIIDNRPVSELTLALNYYFGHYNVSGYHLVNISIHVFNAWMVYLLMMLFLSCLNAREKDRIPEKNGLALFIALVFLVHPIQTGAVSYIIQRMTALASLFYLVAVYLYIRGRKEYLDNQRTGRSILLLILACVSGMLGVLSKQDAIIFPAAFLLVELFIIRNRHGAVCRKYLITGAALLGLLGVAVVLTNHLPAETDTITRQDYLLTQFRVIVKYIQLLILPINQVLDYDFSISSTFFDIKVIAGFVFILALLFLGILWYRSKKIISFGIFWFFLTLSVTSTIIPIKDVIVEHRLYLPAIGFSMILVYTLFYYLYEKRKKLLIILLCTIAAIYAFTSYQRNFVWQTEYSLWKDVTEKSPSQPRAWTNLGMEMIKQGKPDSARQYFEKALQIDPTYAQAWNNLGYLAEKQGDLSRALSRFLKAIDRDPNLTDALINAGKILVVMEREQEAIHYFDRAIKSKPGYPHSYNNMAIAYIRMDSVDLGIKYLNESLKLKSENDEALKLLGKCYFIKGQYEVAVSFYRKYLAHVPKDVEIITELGLSYENLGEVQKARECYHLALHINPGYEPARSNLERLN